MPTGCINYEDTQNVSHIDCNYDAIVNPKSLGDPNYIFTHHEYASIAGVESRHSNSELDLSISNQLAQYEKWVQVKKLGKRGVGQTDASPGKVASVSGLTQHTLFNFNMIQQYGIETLFQSQVDFYLFTEAAAKWPYDVDTRSKLQRQVKDESTKEFDRILSEASAKWYRFANNHSLDSGDLGFLWSGKTTSASCSEVKGGEACRTGENAHLEVKSNNPHLLISFKIDQFGENAFLNFSLLGDRTKKKQECLQRFKEKQKDPSVLFVEMEDGMSNQEEKMRSGCEVLYMSLEVR